jgi:hypothetical protein
LSWDSIDYPKIVQDALRDAVRRLLELAAEHGLPGEHHFFLAFRTQHPGVQVPPFLRDQYPEEMTIIIQHQYWDLEVAPEDFSVVLSFNAARHRLVVPFAALTAFFDPVAQFALRFEPEPGAAAASEPEPAETTGPAAPAAPEPGRSGEVIRFDPKRRK